MPSNITQATVSANLGPLVRVFVPKKRPWSLIIFMFVVGLATSWLLVGLWMLWEISRLPNVSRSQAARRLYLYERGFVIADKPDNPQVYRWDDIGTVFQKIVSRRSYGIEVARQHEYTITRKDGQTVKVTQFWDGIADLGPIINQCVSQALMPGVLAAIDRGQGVQFGDLTLSAVGVAGPRKQVTWAEVNKFTIANGHVRMGVAGKFLSLSTTAVAEIPNLPLFLTLAERLRAAAQR